MIFLSSVLHRLAHNRLSVFRFHKVPSQQDPFSPSDINLAGFSNLLDFIERHFQVLPLSDAVSRLVAGKLGKGGACITFDDGYFTWTTGVVPVLEQRSLPATFFITTGQFFGRPLWHERLANIVRSAKLDFLDTNPFRLPQLPIGTLKEKQVAIKALEYHFRYLPIVIRDKYLLELEEVSDVQPASLMTMSVQQLREISSKGFDIGAQTISHPILSLCNAERARLEIGETKETLEGIIGGKVTAFAYPNGRPYVDFTHQHIAMVKEFGYTHALTTQFGAATQDTSIFQIPRFTPLGSDQAHLSFQVIRNLLIKPECIKEVI